MAVADLIINISAQGVQSLNQVNTGIKTFSANTRSLGAGAKIAAFAMKALPPVGMALAVAGVAKSVSNLVDASTKLGDRFHKIGQRTGLTVETLSVIGHNAELAGSSIQEVEGALRRFGSSIYDASRGVGTAVPAFEDLGISVTNADGSLRSIDDILIDVSREFTNMETDSRKAGIAADLFGRTLGQQMIPLLSNVDTLLEDFNGKMSTDFANASAEYIDNNTRVQAAITGVGNKITELLLPAFNDITTAVLDVFDTEEDWGNLGEAISTFGQVVAGAVKPVVELFKFILNNFATVINLAKQAADVTGLSANLGDQEVIAREKQDLASELRDLKQEREELEDGGLSSADRAALKTINRKITQKESRLEFLNSRTVSEPSDSLPILPNSGNVGTSGQRSGSAGRSDSSALLKNRVEARLQELDIIKQIRELSTEEISEYETLLQQLKDVGTSYEDVKLTKQEINRAVEKELEDVAKVRVLTREEAEQLIAIREERSNISQRNEDLLLTIQKQDEVTSAIAETLGIMSSETEEIQNHWYSLSDSLDSVSEPMLNYAGYAAAGYQFIGDTSEAVRQDLSESFSSLSEPLTDYAGYMAAGYQFSSDTSDLVDGELRDSFINLEEPLINTAGYMAAGFQYAHDMPSELNAVALASDGPISKFLDMAGYMAASEQFTQKQADVLDILPGKTETFTIAAEDTVGTLNKGLEVLGMTEEQINTNEGALDEVDKTLVRLTSTAGLVERTHGSIYEGIKGLITGTQTWGGALSEIGSTILASVISGFAAIAASKVFKWLFGSSSIFNPDQLGTGGIIRKPQLAVVGENGPEAIVPLPDGQNIPLTQSSDGSPEVVLPNGRSIPTVSDYPITETSKVVAERAIGKPLENIEPAEFRDWLLTDKDVNSDIGPINWRKDFKSLLSEIKLPEFPNLDLSGLANIGLPNFDLSKINLGTLPDLSGLLPDLSGLLPDLSGLLPDLSGLLSNIKLPNIKLPDLELGQDLINKAKQIRDIINDPGKFLENQAKKYATNLLSKVPGVNKFLPGLDSFLEGDVVEGLITAALYAVPVIGPFLAQLVPFFGGLFNRPNPRIKRKKQAISALRKAVPITKEKQVNYLQSKLAVDGLLQDENLDPVRDFYNQQPPVEEFIDMLLNNSSALGEGNWTNRGFKPPVDLLARVLEEALKPPINKPLLDLLKSRRVAVPAYAQGGIVNNPQLALVGEGGPEAVIPLSKNKSIPVQTTNYATSGMKQMISVATEQLKLDRTRNSILTNILHEHGNTLRVIADKIGRASATDFRDILARETLPGGVLA